MKQEPTESELERNVGYVVDVVKDNPGKYDNSNLIIKTRLKHSREHPLGLRDARNAVATAVQRKLIKTTSSAYSFLSLNDFEKYILVE